MGSKMDETKSEVVRVRMTPSLREQCAEARDSGSWSGRTEADFMGYLTELGLVRYKKSILPIEKGEDLDQVVPRNGDEGRPTRRLYDPAVHGRALTGVLRNREAEGEQQNSG